MRFRQTRKKRCASVRAPDQGPAVEETQRFFFLRFLDPGRGYRITMLTSLAGTTITFTIVLPSN